VLFNRYPSAIILDSTTAIGVDTNGYVFAESSQCFINGIVQYLIDQVVQACAAAVADIHIRPFAHRLHAPKYLYVARIVSVIFHIHFLRVPLLRPAIR
jgi:hypothetical protein